MGPIDTKYLLIAGAVAIMAGPQILAFFKKMPQAKPAVLPESKTLPRAELVSTLISLQDEVAHIAPSAAKHIGQAVITMIQGETR